MMVSVPKMINFQDKGAAGLQIFWHRAGWLVLLLLCQSSSSFILQRISRHREILELGSAYSGYSGYKFFILVVVSSCAGHSDSKDLRPSPWTEMETFFSFVGCITCMKTI